MEMHVGTEVDRWEQLMKAMSRVSNTCKKSVVSLFSNLFEGEKMLAAM